MIDIVRVSLTSTSHAVDAAKQSLLRITEPWQGAFGIDHDHPCRVGTGGYRTHRGNSHGRSSSPGARHVPPAARALASTPPNRLFRPPSVGLHAPPPGGTGGRRRPGDGLALSPLAASPVPHGVLGELDGDPAEPQSGNALTEARLLHGLFVRFQETKNRMRWGELLLRGSNLVVRYA